MPYGQIVYNLIDYSAEGEKLINSPENLFLDQNKKPILLSEIDNLTQDKTWVRVAIQAPPYSRWLIRQKNNNTLNKIIRIGKSGFFEFDKDIEIQYLSYIPSKEKILNITETENLKTISIQGFNIIENDREKRKKEWKIIDNNKPLGRVADNIEIIKGIEYIVLSNKATPQEELWNFIKLYHSDAPGILQFNKKIIINNGKIEGLKEIEGKTYSYPWTKDATFELEFALKENSDLKNIFINTNNTIRSEYDDYIEYNKNYYENGLMLNDDLLSANEKVCFVNYYDKYLKAKRGVYDDSEEIIPYDVIIDYYYKEGE